MGSNEAYMMDLKPAGTAVGIVSSGMPWGMCLMSTAIDCLTVQFLARGDWMMMLIRLHPCGLPTLFHLDVDLLV